MGKVATDSVSLSFSSVDTMASLTDEKMAIDQPPSQPSLESMYIIGQVLDRGEFGVVRFATHIETGNSVAIKTVKCTDDLTMEEVRLQQMVDHEGVVKIFDVIEEDCCTHIVMEYMAKGSLLDLLVSGVRLTEAQTGKYFLQVIAAVKACHAVGVAHRDLKLENILLDGHGNAKLGDFGLAAKVVPGHLLSGCCGSPNYAAPELWTKGAQYHGQPADVWSCGVVLYGLLTGQMAYDADDISSLVRNVISADYKVPSRTSPEANDLLAKMFLVDPACRITVDEICQHSWIS